MSIIELTSKAKEYKQLQQLIAQAETEIEQLKTLFKAEMAARNTNELEADIFKVKLTRIETNCFDTKAFKATHTALYEQYIKPSISERLTVA